MSRDVPRIDYTAKDYDSLREEIFRLANLYIPQWTDRNPGDPGVMFVELMAHLTDMMLHYQERIASESFPSTAQELRSTIDLLRLIGYELEYRIAARVTLLLRYHDTKERKLKSYSKFSTSSALPFVFLPGDDFSDNQDFITLPNLPGRYELAIASPQIISPQFLGYAEDEHSLSVKHFQVLEVYSVDQTQRILPIQEKSSDKKFNKDKKLFYYLDREQGKIKFLRSRQENSFDSKTLLIVYDVIDGEREDTDELAKSIFGKKYIEAFINGNWQKQESEKEVILSKTLSPITFVDPYSHRGKLLRIQAKIETNDGENTREFLYGGLDQIHVEKNKISTSLNLKSEGKTLYIPWDKYQSQQDKITKIGVVNEKKLVIERTENGRFIFSFISEESRGTICYLYSENKQILIKLTFNKNFAEAKIHFTGFDKMWVEFPENITNKIRIQKEGVWEDKVIDTSTFEKPTGTYFEIFPSIEEAKVTVDHVESSQIIVVKGLPVGTIFHSTSSLYLQHDLNLYLENSKLYLPILGISSFYKKELNEKIFPKAAFANSSLKDYFVQEDNKSVVVEIEKIDKKWSIILKKENKIHTLFSLLCKQGEIHVVKIIDKENGNNRVFIPQVIREYQGFFSDAQKIIMFNKDAQSPIKNKAKRFHYERNLNEEIAIYFPAIQGKIQKSTFSPTDAPLQSHQFPHVIDNEFYPLFCEGWMKVKIGGEFWQRKNNLLSSSNEDKHYAIRLNIQHHQEIYSICFGDGVNGQIPKKEINVSYLSGEGSTGNVAAHTITEYLSLQEDTFSWLAFSLTNPLPAWGGKDLQTQREAMRQAPKNLRSLQRIVSKNDLIQIIENYPGIWRATAEEFHFRSIAAYAMPNQKGMFIPQNLQEHIESLRPITIHVHVRAPIYLDVKVFIKIDEYILPGYRSDSVKIGIKDRLGKYFNLLDFNEGEGILQRERLKTEVISVAGIDPSIPYFVGKKKEIEQQIISGIYLVGFYLEEQEKLYSHLKDIIGKEAIDKTDYPRIADLTQWLKQEIGISLKLDLTIG